MDPIKLQKIEAINKFKKHQFFDTFFLLSMTVLTCSLLCLGPFWFPSMFAYCKFFLSVSLPKLISIFLSSKSIFIVGNLIVILLIGESKLFSPNHSTGDVYYDEYINQKRSLQSSSNLEDKKESKKEETSEETTNNKISEIGRNLDGKGRDSENLKVKEDLYEVDEASLATEELNKRADEFIARINRQRRLEARQLLCYSN